MNSPYKFDHKDEAPPTNKKFNFEGIKPKIKPCLKITIPQSPKFSSLARHRHCVDSAQAVQMPPPGIQNGMNKQRNGIVKKNERRTQKDNEKNDEMNNGIDKERNRIVNKNERRIEKDNQTDKRRIQKGDEKNDEMNSKDHEVNSKDDEMDSKYDEMNSSIEIPEFFVKGRRTSKQNLRKSSPLTKGPVVTASADLTGVEYQRHRIHEERNLLQKYCYRWYDILNDDNQNIPSDIRDEIDCVIGQTKLLTSDKFQQMSNLVDQYENQSCAEAMSGTAPVPATAAATGGGPRILENDLDSFWDMIYIQVDLMYKKFDRLKRLESDNWIDKEEEEAKAKKLAAATKKTVAAKKGPGGAAKAPAAGKSRLADFIRTKRMQAQNNGELEDKKKSETETDETKSFTGVFFKIESPVSKKRSKASPKFTPHVQKGILKNKMSAINMIAVSPLAKSLATTSLVDVISTPSDEMRSILKKKTGKTAGTEPKPFTSGGKKICFSLNEPTTDDEIFSTPRETPQKRIRKTPHKPPQTFSPSQEDQEEAQQYSPDQKENQTQDDQEMNDNETHQTDDDLMDDTFSVTLCESTTSELVGNLGNLQPRRSTRTSSRRTAEGDDLSSVLRSISLNTSRNNGSQRKSPRKSSQNSVKIAFKDSNLSENKSAKKNPARKSSRKSAKITFEDSLSENESETKQETNLSPKRNLRKSIQKSVQITFENSSSEDESTSIEPETHVEEQSSSPKKQLRAQNRSLQFLSVPGSYDSPQQSAYLPRRSPRVSRQPVRFSPGDKNNNTPLRSKNTPSRAKNTPLKSKNTPLESQNTPSQSKKLSKSKTRTGSSESNHNRSKNRMEIESKENRTPNERRTPRKSSNTPSKGSSTSSSKGKFVLRPSRLAV